MAAAGAGAGGGGGTGGGEGSSSSPAGVAIGPHHHGSAEGERRLISFQPWGPGPPLLRAAAPCRRWGAAAPAVQCRARAGVRPGAGVGAGERGEGHRGARCVSSIVRTQAISSWFRLGCGEFRRIRQPGIEQAALGIGARLRRSCAAAGVVLRHCFRCPSGRCIDRAGLNWNSVG